MSGSNICTKSAPSIEDLCISDKIADQNVFQSSFQSDLNQNEVVHYNDDNSTEDYEFSDVVLKYINNMLMDEDIGHEMSTIQEFAALQEAEKSLYDVIGKNYPPSPDHVVPNLHERKISFEENCIVGDHNNYTSTSGVLCPNWNFSLQNNGLIDSPESILNVCGIFSDNSPSVDLGKDSFLGKGIDNRVVSDVKSESYGSKGKKNLYNDDEDLEEFRSNKHSAVYTEPTVRSEIFDRVLLCSKGKNESALREALQSGANNSNVNNSQSKSKGPTGRKPRGKKQGSKQNVVDLRTLLTLCAQAVASDDRRTANDLLKEIRQHSSPIGDGMQRLAHYFADGLEGRMAGSGTQIYKSLISFPVSAVDLLKAYQLYLATCPFRRITNFFSNKTIWNVSEKASRLHIVDIGILYGFQWPSLIQRLSSRPGGPPKLRITGIDWPHPGFKPSQRVDETGIRLATYAETFNVPFEFHAIAKKWETIRIEDLDIREDEVLVVNSLYRFRNLLDETVVINSPRDIVLKLIRDMNPHTFILGIVNGAYSAPFFSTRFREALFHYSSLFDMLDANIPRGIHERMLLEKIIFGKEAMNVIACEGAERIERPETYKQWQVRNVRAGFEQLPLDKEIMNVAKRRGKEYHKDYLIDEDSQWLLQGWKGRIVYALSSWRST